MKALQTRLDKQNLNMQSKRSGNYDDGIRPCQTVWFQAWKYDKESEILAGLLESIFNTMAKAGFFNQAKGEIFKLAKGVNKLKILGIVFKLALGLDISSFFKNLEYKKQLGYYDVFKKFFEDLICTYLNWRFGSNREKSLDDRCGAVVIFIDDLDRCPPYRIVKVLETVKLFMDHKGCIFVIGAARNYIIKALNLTNEYSKHDANLYMDKIVDVNFNLPKLPQAMLQPYLEKLCQDQSKTIPFLPFILAAMGNNPRHLKKFINSLNLRQALFYNSGATIGFDSILLWDIIELVFPEIADSLKENPNNLFIIKQHFETISSKMGHRNIWMANEKLLKEFNVPQSLHNYIFNEPAIKILDSFTIGKDDFTKLLTFSSILESEESVVEEPKEPTRVDNHTETMVEILPGLFKFGDESEDNQIDAPYWIDIYPVTNARYEEFISAGGYETQKWWTEAGWLWRERNRILRPNFWDDEKWNQGNHPVVGVSWYEAAAYCNWLTEVSIDGFKYHLPSEKQWERAARGVKGLYYPWGDDFDLERCNTKESGKGGTTRVDLYVDGLSPEGCYDMAGNVWEWSSDFFDENQDSYSLKGGSWYFRAEEGRCTYRYRYFLDYRSYDVGFRCARTLK
jgi:iron(II)-dependent oxidoreductase